MTRRFSWKFDSIPAAVIKELNQDELGSGLLNRSFKNNFPESLIAGKLQENLENYYYLIQCKGKEKIYFICSIIW